MDAKQFQGAKLTAYAGYTLNPTTGEYLHPGGARLSISPYQHIKDFITARRNGVRLEIDSYHAYQNAAVRTIPMDYKSGSSDRLVGFEIELVSGMFQKDTLSRASRPIPSCRAGGSVVPYCVFETDASIPSGFEIVTRPGTLAAHANPLFVLCKSVGMPLRYTKEGAPDAEYVVISNATRGRTNGAQPSGTHINIDVSDLSSAQRGALQSLCALPAINTISDDYHRVTEHVQLWAEWAGRRVGEYGNGAPSHVPENGISSRSTVSDRPVVQIRARNTHEVGEPSNVLEYRAFRGAANFDFLMSRATALVALADFVKQMPDTTSEPLMRCANKELVMGQARGIYDTVAATCENEESARLLRVLGDLCNRGLSDRGHRVEQPLMYAQIPRFK